MLLAFLFHDKCRNRKLAAGAAEEFLSFFFRKASFTERFVAFL